MWRRLNAKGDPTVVFRELFTRYSEPHRAYHNLRHIGACLEELELVRKIVGRGDVVETAIWFHDVIYDPKAKDNEAASTALASKVLSGAGLTARFVSEVERLILATQRHEPTDDRDLAYFTDIDLSILGKPPKQFDEYEAQIRIEYNWVSKEDFAAGRTKVLKSFLGRKNIYASDFFREKYEAAARENLERSIKRLHNPG